MYQIKSLIIIGLFTSSLAASVAKALTVPLSLTPGPTVADVTLVFSASLTGLGITQIGSITIMDDGTPVGGSNGIFSGFDLDAIFLDTDGSLATSDDRFFASEFIFSAGTTRPTVNPLLLPNAAHPGPTFGSLNATTVDLATATLNLLDGAAVAAVDEANGFLSLGDGGSLIANFAPEVPITGSLFLFTGEVGGQAEEGLGANIFLSDAPSNRIPEPTTLVLIGLGLGGAYLMRRRNSRSNLGGVM